MKGPISKLSRRNFLLAASAGSAVAVATVGRDHKEQQPEKTATSGGGSGYRVTEHVRKYYDTAKV